MAKMEQNQVSDILRLEGVGCRGFGILPKFVAMDVDLSLGAKALYAYFCSLAGSGTCSFPKRDTIIKHLKISKDTYYTYYNELLKAGYITVYQERKERGFTKNIYTIVQEPDRFKRMNLNSIQEKPGYDIVYADGILQCGYGVIPRMVMMDPRLDIKAKGIYAYYVTYAGAGHSTRLKRGLILRHLGISHNTYYKHLNALIDLNYITTEQRKSDGRFSSTTFILNTHPDVEKAPRRAEAECEPPCTNFQDTQDIVENDNNIEEKHKLPCTSFSDTEKKPPCTSFSDTQNQDTNNIDIKNNSRFPSFPKSLSSDTGQGMSKKKERRRAHSLLDSEGRLRDEIKPDYETAQEAIRELYPYDFYKNQFKISQEQDAEAEEYEFFVNVLSGMLSSDREMKAKGAIFYYSHVIKRINHIMASSYMPDKRIEFCLFARDFIKYLGTVLQNYDVDDIMTYARSVMWEWLNKYTVQKKVDMGCYLASMDKATPEPDL